MLLTSLDAPGVPGGALSWPGARAMFDNAFDLNLERRIKYLWRLALTWNVRGRLLREFDGQATAQALFRARPRQRAAGDARGVERSEKHWIRSLGERQPAL